MNKYNVLESTNDCVCTNNVMKILETNKPTTTILELTKVNFPRMASTYFQELSDFIIPFKQIQLIETIGQGIVEHVMVTVDLLQ